MMNALRAFMKNSLREFEKAGRNFLAALACPGEDGRLGGLIGYSVVPGAKDGTAKTQRAQRTTFSF